MAARPGSERPSLTDRLLARKEGLSRRTHDGIEVFTGAVADEALKALRAEAFTFDKQIIVPTRFDPRKAKDAGTLAHELLHKEHSGGSGGRPGGQNEHDGEEKEAREVEAMVHHAISTGLTVGDALKEIKAGSSSASIAAPTGPGAPPPAAALMGEVLNVDPQDPMVAYLQMTGEGLSHNEIVEKLSRDVLFALQAAQKEAEGMTGGTGPMG